MSAPYFFVDKTDRKYESFCHFWSSSSNDLVVVWQPNGQFVVRLSAVLLRSIVHRWSWNALFCRYTRDEYLQKVDYGDSTFDVCSMSNDIMAVNFEKLVQRLETATLRLEALSAQKPPIAKKPTGGTPPRQIGNLLIFMICLHTRNIFNCPSLCIFRWNCFDLASKFWHSQLFSTTLVYCWAMKRESREEKCLLIIVSQSVYLIILHQWQSYKVKFARTRVVVRKETKLMPVFQ